MNTTTQLDPQAHSYSQGQHLDLNRMADVSHRARKAEKIRAVLAASEVMIGSETRLLDIGCGQGLILRHLLADGGHGVGVDPDQVALGQMAGQVTFAQANGEQLPFSNTSVDVALCNHVYEHTADPRRLVAEIRRVLKPSGVCYFAGPNKFSPVEPHFGLPLLSWLPQPLADFYVRRAGRGTRYDCNPYSWWALQELLRDFDIVDFTGAVIADPPHFWVDDLLPPGSIKHLMARWLWRLCPWIVPDFVLLLRRRNG